jgi:hypothetical protein
MFDVKSWCEERGLVYDEYARFGLSGEPGVAIYAIEMGYNDKPLYRPIYWAWSDPLKENDERYNAADKNQRVDLNGKVWTPVNRHEQSIVFCYWKKSPLARTISKNHAIKKMEHWMKWFVDHGFNYEKIPMTPQELAGIVEANILGVKFHHRMVKHD